MGEFDKVEVVVVVNVEVVSVSRESKLLRGREGTGHQPLVATLVPLRRSPSRTARDKGKLPGPSWR